MPSTPKRQENSSLEAIVARVQDIIAEVDGTWRYTWLNRAGLQFFGDGVLGSEMARYFVGKQDTYARLRGVFEGTEETCYLRSWQRRTDGQARLLAFWFRSKRDEDGTANGALCTARDVTESDRLQEALERSLKDLSDSMYALDEAAIVVITDPAGRVTYANDQFCELTGCSRADLVTRAPHLSEFLLDSARHLAAMERASLSGKVYKDELRVKGDSGQPLWFHATIVPFKDRRGCVYQNLVICFNVSERKQAEVELRENEALVRLGELAAVVAHEVRNPLAGIRAALEVLGDRVAVADQVVVKDIVTRVDTLNALVDDLLVYARPRPLELSPVSIGEVLERTITLAKEREGGTGVTFEVGGDDCTLLADPRQLEQALVNLVCNAAEAAGEGGWVKVATLVHAGSCVVRVEDSGTGVDPEVQNRVFQPFVTTKARGTGLGLPTTKRIVAAHGGSVVLERSPRDTTEAVVVLPVARRRD